MDFVGRYLTTYLVGTVLPHVSRCCANTFQSKVVIEKRENDISWAKRERVFNLTLLVASWAGSFFAAAKASSAPQSVTILGAATFATCFLLDVDTVLATRIKKLETKEALDEWFQWLLSNEKEQYKTAVKELIKETFLIKHFEPLFLIGCS